MTHVQPGGWLHRSSDHSHRIQDRNHQQVHVGSQGRDRNHQHTWGSSQKADQRHFLVVRTQGVVSAAILSFIRSWCTRPIRDLRRALLVVINHGILVHLIVRRRIGWCSTLVLELLVAHPPLIRCELVLWFCVFVLLASVEAEGNAAADKDSGNGATSNGGTIRATLGAAGTVLRQSPTSLSWLGCGSCGNRCR